MRRDNTVGLNVFFRSNGVGGGRQFSFSRGATDLAEEQTDDEECHTRQKQPVKPESTRRGQFIGRNRKPPHQGPDIK
jgi:hypothetical protein